ncbi:MAG TPA: MaoC family dehydratase [Actinomycetales bacterium]|nr:MaoC family dehydratase [Actinomycetales bacterium]
MSARQVSMKDVPSLQGESLGVSSAVEVSQERINQFAEATGDHQWIHVDVEKAKESPFGGTIAHGYLTLSLVSAAMFELIEVPDADQIINYGLDKVRFMSPVPAGSSIEASAVVRAVDECKGGYQVTVDCQLRIPGAERPACVAAILFRYLGEV